MKLAAFLLPYALVVLDAAVAKAEDSRVAACATAYVQGQVLQKKAWLLDARGAYRVCAQPVCADFMVKDCSAWLDIVEASIPAVIPMAYDSGGNTPRDVRLSIDGSLMRESLDGRAIEVDPGPHTFLFEAADGRTVVKTVLVPESDKWVRVFVTLPAAASALPLALAQPERRGRSAGERRLAPPPRELLRRSEDPWKMGGIVSGGLGVAGLGVGTFFGLDAVSKKRAAGCDAESVCPSFGAAGQLRAAERAGNLATGFFIGGAALAVAGSALWFLAPDPSMRMAAQVAPGGARLAVSAAW